MCDKSKSKTDESERGKLIKPNVDIDLDPDGSQVHIDVNGTVLNVTKTSFNVTIGNFAVTLKPNNSIDIDTSTNRVAKNPLVIVILSSYNGKPLHVLTDDNQVTAKLSLSKQIVNNETAIVM